MAYRAFGCWLLASICASADEGSSAALKREARSPKPEARSLLLYCLRARTGAQKSSILSAGHPRRRCATPSIHFPVTLESPPTHSLWRHCQKLAAAPDLHGLSGAPDNFSYVHSAPDILPAAAIFAIASMELTTERRWSYSCSWASVSNAIADLARRLISLSAARLPSC